ncbi:hypothetical protein QN277_001332 [Acacia crassicarpa]|uniref:Late embryogenesis abundant protein n=1 Tax=Acacia crassicarpa TaxID=499986 RepID=A0AAE1TGN9_9FABA|nr:hypothetical protein QN277_001332 [Acacia crassicarpa]
MARRGFTKLNLLLLRSYREANRGRSTGLSKMCCVAKGEERYEALDEGDGGRGGGGPVWVPHARTGIYVPKGQEGVMKDVPENAAIFTAPYWFRNEDDLNHPSP